MPPKKNSYAWDKPKNKKSKTRLSKPKASRRPSRSSPTSPSRRKPSRRKSSRRRKSSKGSRKSKDGRKSSMDSKNRRRSTRGSKGRRKSNRGSKDRRKSSRKGSRASKDRRKSSRGSRKSKDKPRKSNESPRRKSSTHPPLNSKQRKSISKVKVWQNDPKNNVKNSQNNKKSWQAVPPEGEGVKETGKKSNHKRRSKPSQPQVQGMLDQTRKISPDTAEEEEVEGSDSEDPLDLPKDPEIYMYQQLPLEPEVKKFRPGCSCSTSGRLTCWCKLLAYFEIIFGITLIIFKICVLTAHPTRQQVRDIDALTVDILELVTFSIITAAGILLLVGAGFRLKFLCLAHTVGITLGILTLLVTIILYIAYKEGIKDSESELEGVWWFLVVIKICWLWVFLWSALLSLLLSFRIRQADQMNIVKPMEFTVSPQTYMTKVEMFLNV